MIYVLSLTPCVDKTVLCDHFDTALSNRVAPLRRDLGGKGINCARVISTLGGEVCLLGADFHGAVSEAIARQIPCDLEETNLTLRENLKIFDKSIQKTIEVNEQAPALDDTILSAILQTVCSRLKTGDCLVLCGSLPTGAAPNTYTTFCRAAREKGAFVLADCSGKALKEVLSASPTLIKPNRNEMNELASMLGWQAAQDTAGYQALCERLIREGKTQQVLLSLGKEGAMLVSSEGAVVCPPPDVVVRGDIGAGDAMTAASAMMLSQQQGGASLLYFASAAAGAVLEKEGTQPPEKERVEAIYHSYLNANNR